MSCRRLLVLLAGLALLVPACGWDGHLNLLGYTTRPNYDCGIRTVYVPIFENRTQRLGMEFDLTREVVRQIELKTPYKVVSCRDNADTELIGTIVTINKGIVNRNQLNEVREAELTLGVEIVWRDVRSGNILSLPDRGPDAPPLMPGGIRPGAVPSSKTTGPEATTPLMPAVGSPVQPGTQPLLNQPARPVTATSPAAIQRVAANDQQPVEEAPLPQPLEPPPPGSVPPGTPVPPGAPPLAEPITPPALVQSPGRFIVELGESRATGEQMMLRRLAIQIVSMMEKPW